MSVMGGATRGGGGRLRFSTLPAPLSGGPAKNVIKRAPVVQFPHKASFWHRQSPGQESY